MQINFGLKILGALCAGALLYLAYDNQWLMPLSIVSIMIVIWFLENTKKVLLRCILLTVYIFTYVFLQFSFLFHTAEMVGGCVLWINVIIALIYLIPIYAITAIRSRLYIEMTLVALLISEYIFATIPVGNHLFQFGVLWTNLPIVIQWYEFTGIEYGSLWLVLISYLLYQVIFYKKYYGILICIVIVPIFISLTIDHFLSERLCLFQNFDEICLQVVHTL